MLIDDIDIFVDADESEDPSLIMKVTTPYGDIDLLGEFEVYDDHVIVRRLHIQGSGKGSMGVSKIREIGRVLVEKLNVEYIEIHGAVRTSGAGPGRRPGKIRLTGPVKP